MNMFKAANDISGLNKETLPAELIPLNSIQLSRGLLNFTIIQSRLNWVMPYWAEKQYNPLSQSFIPRSHLGLSMNVTHRNWTGIGTPECNTEPIVDPAGLITPFKDGWSVDIWIKKGKEIFFPSRHDVKQELINNLPVVKTSYLFMGLSGSTTAYTSGGTLIINTEINNITEEDNSFELIISIRPYNPEGISLVNEIEYLPSDNKITINKDHDIFLPGTPDDFLCRKFAEGDTAELLKENNYCSRQSVHCEYGLATAAAVYKQIIEPYQSKEFKIFVLLEKGQKAAVTSLNEHITYWQNLTGRGIQIHTPEKKVDDIFEASVAALLMLTDKDKIMPGPFTYHQFWFRDAAYMLNALDKAGFSDYSGEIINSFRNYQDKDGCFRSQKGEWDSNGQALWTIYQHYLYSGDTDLMDRSFEVCFKAVKWIERNRKNNSFNGLLPSGLSAEHLGLSDYYYWDNFWSLAGIDSFIKMCETLKKENEKNFALGLFNEYCQTVNTLIKEKCIELSLNIITAGPARNTDCGMIGSVCAVYPLLLPVDQNAALRTLDYIAENYFVDGLFFQNFIHSGQNIYLTIQIAHAYLLLGKREMFLNIMQKVTEAASPAHNYPEAIHPHTKGGVMGDGHHGWAAAEYVLAVRDAFIYDIQKDNKLSVTFFSGIPPEWFSEDNDFFIKNAATITGNISASVKISGQSIHIMIEPDFMINAEQNWNLILPVKCKQVKSSGQILEIITNKNETILVVKPGKVNIHLFVCNDTPEEIHC